MAYYNPTITPARTGQGAYGKVPGDVSYMPMPDPWGDVSKIYPNLSGSIGGASDLVKSQIAGKLSSGTTNAITNSMASRGVSQGMPMTNPFNLTSAGLYNTIGKTSEAEQQQGLSNFNSLLSSLTNNLTVNPSVQANINSANAGIAGQNALNSAMPDPAAAAAQQQKLFDDYLAKISGSGGGFNISGAAPSFTPMPTSTSTGRSSFGGAMVGPSGNPYTNPYSVQTIGGNWGGGGTGMYDPSQSYGSQNVTVSGGAQQSPIASAPVGGDGIDYELMNAYGMSPWEWADMSGGLTY